MPLLEVEIVGEVDEADRPALAQRIADAVGRALSSPPQGTWVRARVLRPGEFAESGRTEPTVRPVFVSVIQRTNPEGDSLAVEIRRVTDAVAEACGRPPENVHVRYEVPGAGRQAFGGRLV